MGKMSRDKGRRGQCAFRLLLESRDWVVDPITAGVMREDMVATDPDGRRWSVEVKNTACIVPAHLKQAREQAKARKLPWMLANKLEGTRSWLVRRQGYRPVVWHEVEEDAP